MHFLKKLYIFGKYKQKKKGEKIIIFLLNIIIRIWLVLVYNIDYLKFFFLNYK
jgi:hypothetical protein